jgi:hypothetical protein
MLTMEKSEINEHLTTLESFKYYLEHIIKSIRENDYNLKYVEDLSKTIKDYYDKINSDDSDKGEPDVDIYQNLDDYNENNFEFVDPDFVDDEGTDDELYGFFNNSETSNNDSKDDDEDDDSDNDKEEKIEQKVEKENVQEEKTTKDNHKIKINKKSKERLDNFINGVFAIDKIHLYKKDNKYIERVNNFKNKSECY